jgi:hypothetical protein
MDRISGCRRRHTIGKSLPISSCHRNLSKRPCDRTELDVYAESLGLRSCPASTQSQSPASQLPERTQSIPPCIHQPRIPSTTCRDACREGRNPQRISHTTPTSGLFITLPPSGHTHPKGPSCKHSSGNPIDEIAARFPTQGPFSHPMPVARATLFAFVSLASAVCALVYAAAQSPSPAAARMGLAKVERKSNGPNVYILENNVAQ